MSNAKTNEIEINGIVYVPKGSIKEAQEMAGDYFVIRTRSAGVFAGFVKESVDTIAGVKVTLGDARRLWYWNGAASLSQVAGEGISKPDECKFPACVPEITLPEVIEMIPCSKKAKEIIEGVPVWKS